MTTKRARSYFKRRKEWRNPDYSWWCQCGTLSENGLHCYRCGNEPPWGCDCASCNNKRFDNEDNPTYFFDTFWLQDNELNLVVRNDNSPIYSGPADDGLPF